VFYILLLAREKYNMAVFSFTALLFIALTVKWTEGASYSHVADKVYCDGSESSRGYLTISECARQCAPISQMFIFGTNRFGTNRCKSGKCKCYCEYATTNYRCVKRKAHKGYILYKFPTRRVAFKHVADKVYCDGSETDKGYTSLGDCARKCEGSTQMFIHGANRFGTKRCRSDGLCKCYCQKSTSAYTCKKRKAHNGYILYTYEKKPAYFNQVAAKVECDGGSSDSTDKGYVAGSEACAKVCVGTSEVFIYGTNKYGTNRCKGSTCKCYCQHKTTNGKCVKRKAHNGYVLYSFANEEPEKHISSFELCQKDTAVDLATCTQLPNAMCEIEGRSSKRVKCLPGEGHFTCKGVSEGENVKCCNYAC